MSNCGCAFEAQNEKERATLKIVLAINAFMFLLEFCLGILAQSSGLIADSLDMLADALVFGISLFAVSRREKEKVRLAKMSGYLQIFLALAVLFDVLRKFILGSEPESMLMISVGIVALIANIACLLLLAAHRAAGVHMRASFIFASNDVVANIGLITSGGLVWTWGSRYPDLVIGSLVALLVLRGGVRILQEARIAGEACAETSK